MSNDSETTSHVRGVVVTTVCDLLGIGVGDSSVKDNRHVAFPMFLFEFSGDTSSEMPNAQVVA